MGGLRKIHADHLDHVADRLAGADRHPVLRRLLLQGRDHRGGRGLGERWPRRGASPTARCWSACSSPPSTRSGCSSWSSTASRAGATDGASRPRPRRHGHDDEHHGEPHESPAVITVPLVLLAIPSVVIGFVAIGAMLFGDYFGGAIFVDAAQHPAMEELAAHFHGATEMALHGFMTVPFWLALAGVGLGLVPVPEAARHPGAHPGARSGPLPPARQQVLPRPLQRGRLRRRRPAPRHRPLEGRRPGAHRRRGGQRQRAAGRLGRRPRRACCRPATSTHYAIAMIVGLLVLITLFVTLGVAR